MDVKDIITCDNDDIEKMGIDSDSFVERILEIDEENGLLEEAEGNYERLSAMYKITTDMWRVFMHNGRIIGYWSCLAVSDELRNELETGTLREKDIHTGNVKTDLRNGVNDVLFDAVCLEKPYQKMKLTGIVMKSMYDTFSALASGGAQFGYIWGSVWSEEGRGFFGKLGATHHADNKYSGEIYRAAFPEFMRRLESLTMSFGL